MLSRLIQFSIEREFSRNEDLAAKTGNDKALVVAEALNTAVGRKALVSAGDPDVHVPEHAVVAMAPSGTMPRAAAARAAHQISATSAAKSIAVA